MKRAILTLTLLFASGAMLPVAADETPEIRISRFSDKPVPRFESLRNAKVYGRMGPSQDHPIEWEYRRKGLPVLILKESGDWRFVRDPAGDEVWIKQSQLSASRTALVREALTVRAGRAADSDAAATFGEGVVVELGDCDGGACEVSAEGLKGWAPRAALWGADLPGN
jgi:SH3-like domain-containing protein